jgi:hypothetical protein
LLNACFRENKSFAAAFQVMGLGDMNYSRFNNMGQLTDLNLDAWMPQWVLLQ